jgi:hypothetical protein
MPTSSTVWWPSMCRSPWAVDLEVDQAVAGDLVEHVVEEADAGRELGAAAAVQVEGDADLGFLGVAAEVGGAVHGVRICWSASISNSVSSGVPTVRRRQLASSGCCGAP